MNTRDTRPGLGRPDESSGAELDAVGAGLDVLDTPAPARTTSRRLLRGVLPPAVAIVLIVALWQALWAAAFWPEYKLPAPLAVWNTFWGTVTDGSVFGTVWTSVHRAVLGFLAGVAIGTPLGLLVARVTVIRSAIGPLLSGLQSLPSVAWVPAAVLWFGIDNTAIYFVVLLGSVPSIANGLVAGIDQVQPSLLRVGRALGAGRLATARHILLPAALPGYLAGLKQGWAFSWRSLMAAELIAVSPQLGLGLGAYLDQGRSFNDMPTVLAAIFLILFVGIGIDLLIFRPLETSVLRARGLAGS
ncbi:ABC transporter permease [Amycolatopsis taiwanensis]|uniref:Sulfate ABC transporter permease n=1 Tax=Amycolatopsis taiwanensis TaxID=342230 RepID=A0A9W6R397_9PSEU|nr:ABC transporter permease [Amycolatopsis taiwanensis]GLY66777.1 sulfate ABC transporter permease [Amycolatopsis taiwanensis]